MEQIIEIPWEKIEKTNMNNLTTKEIQQIIQSSYIRGVLGGMLIMAVLYGIHAIVLAYLPY